MTKLQNQLDFLFAGGAVKRFHTVRCVREQNDAEHSWGVAWFIYLLTEGRAPANLIWAALSHDLAEQLTGDLPSMIKRRADIGPPLAEVESIVRSSSGLTFILTPGEQALLDLADYLDGMMYCAAERRLGNLEAARWYYRFTKYIKESGVLEQNQRAVDVFVAVQNVWEEVSCTAINGR